MVKNGIATLMITVLCGCGHGYKTVGEDTAIQCAHGDGIFNQKKPKFATTTTSGTLVVCGHLEKKITPTKYELSELDIYLHKNDNAVHLLNTLTQQKRTVEFKAPGEIEITQSLQSGQELFQRKVICTADTCGLGPETCLIKKENFNTLMADSAGHDKELIEKAREICK